MADEIPKMDLKSKDITEEQKQKLKQLFPEVFTEDKIDFEKLRQTLGEEIEDEKERYELSWAGKSQCIKVAQERTTATLKPCREESVNFDTTENLFIEGDNLEVLKLLQKSYSQDGGKIKMIYIDPPYNTGNDFVYNDKFGEELQNYLKLTGQTDEEGRKLTTNTEASGRYHSNWLNMMYPRLVLAKNLLREEGVIFVSIDDHEVDHLRQIMDEIFGEENHLSTLVWDLRGGTSAGHFTRAHEYILVYSKNKNLLPNFPASDNSPITGRTTIRPTKVNPITQIEFPAGMRFEGRDAIFSGIIGDAEPVRILSEKMIFENGKLKYGVTLESAWRMRDQMINWIGGKETFDSKGQKVLEIYFNEKGIPWYKKERGFINPKSVVRTGSTKEGTLELEDIFGTRVIQFPKPSSLIKYLVDIPTIQDRDDITLDFFAGSGTTAHAVLDLNKEDGGNRRFIMVQLPEPTPEDSEALKAGYDTIADIGKERIRRVIRKIKEEQKTDQKKLNEEEKPPHDLGFKVFKLDKSNFRIWDVSSDELTQSTLSEHVETVEKSSTPEDLLYELILKDGLELTEKIEEKELAGKKIYAIMDTMLICLEKELTLELVREMAKLKPSRIICLDEGFRGNDQLKSNAAKIFSDLGEQVIFKTV